MNFFEEFGECFRKRYRELFFRTKNIKKPQANLFAPVTVDTNKLKDEVENTKSAFIHKTNLNAKYKISSFATELIQIILEDGEFLGMETEEYHCTIYTKNFKLVFFSDRMSIKSCSSLSFFCSEGELTNLQTGVIVEWKKEYPSLYQMNELHRRITSFKNEKEKEAAQLKKEREEQLLRKIKVLN